MLHLHFKLKYTFCILNYDLCYTLHNDIKFVVNLDENLKLMGQSVMRSIV